VAVTDGKSKKLSLLMGSRGRRTDHLSRRSQPPQPEGRAKAARRAAAPTLYQFWLLRDRATGSGNRAEVGAPLSISFGCFATSYQFLRHISDKTGVTMTETDRKSKKIARTDRKSLRHAGRRRAVPQFPARRASAPGPRFPASPLPRFPASPVPRFPAGSPVPGWFPAGRGVGGRGSSVPSQAGRWRTVPGSPVGRGPRSRRAPGILRRRRR
jgi:hypothetical protein